MGTSNKPTTRPGIATLGQVITVGDITTVTGWGLTVCAIRCECHFGVGPTRPIYISCDETKGTLGLRTFAEGGQCTCCGPWTADELTSVLADLAAFADPATPDMP